MNQSEEWKQENEDDFSGQDEVQGLRYFWDSLSNCSLDTKDTSLFFFFPVFADRI